MHNHKPINFLPINPQYMYQNLSINRNSKNIVKLRDAKALVLTCIDYRFFEKNTVLLQKLGLNTQYDGFILAGGSLGYTQEKYQDWKTAYNEHLQLAKELHHIKGIVAIDHMDCAKYKKVYNNGNNIEHNVEIQLHKHNMLEFKKRMGIMHKDLITTCFLIDVNGKLILQV
jgi:hypothetical protein